MPHWRIYRSTRSLAEAKPLNNINLWEHPNNPTVLLGFSATRLFIVTNVISTVDARANARSRTLLCSRLCTTPLSLMMVCVEGA